MLEKKLGIINTLQIKACHSVLTEVVKNMPCQKRVNDIDVADNKPSAKTVRFTLVKDVLQNLETTNCKIL